MRRTSAAIIAGVTLIGLADASAGTALDERAVTRQAPLPAAMGRVAANQTPPSGEVDVPTPLLPIAGVGPGAPGGKPPAAAVAGPGGTLAFDAKQRSLVDRVNAYLTSVQTLVGDFVQVGPDGSRSEGKFYLQKPGRIRFEYDPPNPVELIADGSSMAVRDRKLATQDLYPLSQTPLRFLLADRIDLLKDTNLVGVYADDLFVTLVIEERQVFGGTHRLLLMFGAQDYQLRQWTITDPQGYDTTVAVYNLDATQKLDPGLFKIDYERVLQ